MTGAGIMRTRRARPAAVVLVGLALLSLVGPSASGSDVTGTAGTETALPLTESAVTVRGRGPFADLEVTVNQTRNLVNQAVSVTWKGGTQTIEVVGAFGSDYLQIMQCWGDDDGTHPENPGPPPEQCAFGATNGVYGGISGSPFPPGSLASERIISRRGWENFDPDVGVLDERTGNVWREFVAVDGSRIGNHIDPSFNPNVEGGVYWQNPFFNIVTTNEVAGARTLANGKGAEFVEVVTGIENSGLGCGQTVERVAGGGARIPRCWLVVVPRGSPELENEGTPFGPTSGVVTSPLSPARWQHRIAIPLEFNPVDTACKLGDDSTRLVGNELVIGAISSWQPKLCATPGLRPYSYGVVSDAGARQQLLVNAPGSPGMYVMSRPIDQSALDPTSPVVYAPLTISGLTVGFNIERRPALLADGEAKALQGVRVANLNLTPRLVAKLLTQSYVGQVAIKQPPPYDWIDANPLHLGEDEDFLRFNPEFRELDPVWRKEFGGLLLPAGSSDAAQQLWEYVLSDPEAKAWLDGAADEWGMRVNPVYATTAEANSQGTPFAADTPSNLPKADPYCYQAPDTPQGIRPPLLCGTDWTPYTQSLRDGSRLARAATDGARLEENAFATSSDRYYSRTPPQPPGSRTILALTDTPSANLFGLQAARLSRAGDDGDERSFIEPDSEGLTAGVRAMVPRAEAAVLEPDPTTTADGAYPLTLVTYAAIRPLDLTTEARREFAAFIEYAAGDGQVSGPRYGQLPVGYAPLTDALRTQARRAAATIRELQPPTAQAPSPPEGTPAATSFPGTFGQPRGTAAGPTSAPRASAPAMPGQGSPLSPGDVELASTPAVPVPLSRLVLPGLLALTLLSGLGALEITKRPRRATIRSPHGSNGATEAAP